jgi:hypothetical protein
MRFERVVGCRCLQKRKNTCVRVSYPEQKRSPRLRRSKELLKETLIILMPALLLLFFVSTTSPNLDRARPSNATKPSGGNNSSSTNSEATQPNMPKQGTGDVKATFSFQEPKANVAENQSNKAEPENELATNQSTAAPSPGETGQSGDSANATPLPDGRIYLGPDPPYAYVPTSTHKGTLRMPMAPPEPEG